MRIKCESCGTIYNFPDERIAENGTPVKCKMCGHTFVAYRGDRAKPVQEPDGPPTPTDAKREAPPPATAPEPPPPAPQRTPPPSSGAASEPMREPDVEQFAAVHSAPPKPRQAAADIPEIDMRVLRPAETWLKFTLGFAVCIGACLLAWFFFTSGPESDEVWEKLEAQVDKEKDLERQLDKTIAARERIKSHWDYYYDGLSAMSLATDEGYLKAQSDFQTAIERKPDLAAAYAGLAEATVGVRGSSQNENVLADAERSAKKALELDPNLVAGHRAMAEIALTRGDLKAAQAEIDKALVLDPNDGATHLTQARLHLVDNRHDLAAESLLNAVSNEPLLLDANFLLSQLYANRTDWAQAVNYARRAEAINPNHEEVHQYVRIYEEQLERERNPEIARVEREQQLGPEVGPPPSPIEKDSEYQELMRAGQALQSQNALWKAVGKFQKASDIEPSRCEPLEALGFVYYDLNQVQSARVHFTRALSGGPACSRSHIGMATLLQDEGKKSEAIEQYEKFLAVNPRGPQADEVRAIVSHLRESQ